MTSAWSMQSMQVYYTYLMLSVVASYPGLPMFVNVYIQAYYVEINFENRERPGVGAPMCSTCLAYHTSLLLSVCGKGLDKLETI